MCPFSVEYILDLFVIPLLLYMHIYPFFLFCSQVNLDDSQSEDDVDDGNISGSESQKFVLFTHSVCASTQKSLDFA